MRLVHRTHQPPRASHAQHSARRRCQQQRHERSRAPAARACAPQSCSVPRSATQTRRGPGPGGALGPDAAACTGGRQRRCSNRFRRRRHADRTARMHPSDARIRPTDAAVGCSARLHARAGCLLLLLVVLAAAWPRAAPSPGPPRLGSTKGPGAAGGRGSSARAHASVCWRTPVQRYQVACSRVSPSGARGCRQSGWCQRLLP